MIVPRPGVGLSRGVSSAPPEMQPPRAPGAPVYVRGRWCAIVPRGGATNDNGARLVALRRGGTCS